MCSGNFTVTLDMLTAIEFFFSLGVEVNSSHLESSLDTSDYRTKISKVFASETKNFLREPGAEERKR